MGFDDLSGWDRFEEATTTIENTPGVFKDEAEKKAVLDAIQHAVDGEHDTAKKLKLAESVASAVGDAIRGGLKSLPMLAGLL